MKTTKEWYEDWLKERQVHNLHPINQSKSLIIEILDEYASYLQSFKSAESPVLPEITDEMIADYFNDHAKEFVNNGYTVTRCMDRDNALEMVKHFCLQSKATPQVIDKDNDDFIANDARMDM